LKGGGKESRRPYLKFLSGPAILERKSRKKSFLGVSSGSGSLEEGGGIGYLDKSWVFKGELEEGSEENPGVRFLRAAEIKGGL